MSSLKAPLDIFDCPSIGAEPGTASPNFDFGKAPFLLKTSNNARGKAERKFEHLLVRGPKATRRSPGHSIADFRPNLLPDLEESGTEEEELLDMLTSPEPHRKPKVDSLGVKLQINVAPAECEDHSRILPIISLGSVYLLTKPGARLASLPHSTFPWLFAQNDNDLWSSASMLGGKLVFWACKRAAEEAYQAAKTQWQRLRPSSSARKTARPLERDYLLEDLLTPVDLEQELIKQEEGERITAYASADWRVSTLPKFHSCGPFGWPWRRKEGKQDGQKSVSWRRAVVEQKFKMVGSAAYLIQLPLFHAITYMQNRLKGEERQNFTMSSALNEVCSAKRRAFGRKPSRESGDLAVFSVPGVWMLMPSSKGWVKFSPYFLSRDELLKSWDLSLHFWLKGLLQKREKQRYRELTHLRDAMGKWAIKTTGITNIEDSSTAVPSSEYEPSELKELLKEMGMQQQNAQSQKKIKFRLGPLNLLTIVACGAALTAAEIRFKAATALDRLCYGSSLGKRVALRLSGKPVIQAHPMTQILDNARLHNDSVLAKTYEVSLARGEDAGRSDEQASAAAQTAEEGSGPPPTAVKEGLQDSADSHDDSPLGNAAADQGIESKDKQGTQENGDMPDNEQTTGQLQKLGPATAAEISKESVSSEVEPGDESADLSTQLAEEVKAEVLEMTKDMVELYTVMTGLVGDDSLSFFRQSDFGSGKLPLQQSHASFVHDLSQSTAAIGLTILKAAVKTLANGLEVTPIGHSFKLLDSREGQRRWLVQLPKPTPMTEFQPSEDSHADAKAHNEAAADEAEAETDLKDSVSSSVNVGEAVDNTKSSRCSYAMANFDLNEAVGRRNTVETDNKATDDFLKGVVLVGDLQVRSNLLPEEVSVGISNASRFGEQFRRWP